MRKPRVGAFTEDAHSVLIRALLTFADQRESEARVHRQLVQHIGRTGPGHEQCIANAEREARTARELVRCFP